jgi:ferredoxin
MNAENTLVTVSIETVLCRGCEACVELAPEVFGFDPHAEVATVKSPTCTQAQAREAAVYCPEDCIEWEKCEA